MAVDVHRDLAMRPPRLSPHLKRLTATTTALTPACHYRHTTHIITTLHSTTATDTAPRIAGCQLQALLNGSGTRLDRGVRQSQSIHIPGVSTHSASCCWATVLRLHMHKRTRHLPRLPCITTPLQRSPIPYTRLPTATPPRVHTHITATQHPKPAGPSVDPQDRPQSFQPLPWLTIAPNTPPKVRQVQKLRMPLLLQTPDTLAMLPVHWIPLS